MIALTIAALFTVICLATALTLVDFWLRGRSAYGSLRRQSELLKAGFVPQVEAKVVRLRPNAPRFAAIRPLHREAPRPALAAA